MFLLLISPIITCVDALNLVWPSEQRFFSGRDALPALILVCKSLSGERDYCSHWQLLTVIEDTFKDVIMVWT
jgi:hypothetical protein